MTPISIDEVRIWVRLWGGLRARLGDRIWDMIWYTYEETRAHDTISD
jgi:hypothetical protein